MQKVENWREVTFKEGVELQKEYIGYMIKHLTEGNKKYHDEILVQLLGTIDEELGNEYCNVLKGYNN